MGASNRRTVRLRGRLQPPLRCRVAVGAAACLALAFTPAAGQLPRASAAGLGVGNHTTATVRGFAAVATNPAGLAMPRPSRFTLTVLPTSLESGMDPVTLQDLGEYDGRAIPASVREAWLERIALRGHQRGTGEAAVSGLALAQGRLGVQVSALAVARGDLNPDAAELLLFGNAGRTGQTREFFLGGSRFDAYLVSTVAVGLALPLEIDVGDAPGQTFAVGATVKYTVGNRLFLARDVGTAFSGHPLEVELRFPVLQTDAARGLGSGDGVAFDLGAQWDGGRWGAGLVVQNVVSTFRWDEGRLVFRPGTALFTQDTQESDFDPRPATEAPESLLAPARQFRFAPLLAAGVAHRPSAYATLTGEVRGRMGRGVSLDPDWEAGVGLEYRIRSRWPLRAHAAVFSNGVRVGGGAGLTLGNAHLEGATSFQFAGADETVAAMLGVSFGGS